MMHGGNKKLRQSRFEMGNPLSGREEDPTVTTYFRAEGDAQSPPTIQKKPGRKSTRTRVHVRTCARVPRILIRRVV